MTKGDDPWRILRTVFRVVFFVNPTAIGGGLSAIEDEDTFTFAIDLSPPFALTSAPDMTPLSTVPLRKDLARFRSDAKGMDMGSVTQLECRPNTPTLPAMYTYQRISEI
jgi:hypothetical protein